MAMKTALFVAARLITHDPPPCTYCTKEATHTIATGADPEREPRCDYHTWSTLLVATGSLDEKGVYQTLAARSPQP